MNKIFTSLILMLGFILISATTYAEKTEVLEEVPSPPNTLDSGYEYEPEITIRKEGTKRIEEHRDNGNLYYIKVTPDRGFFSKLINTVSSIKTYQLVLREDSSSTTKVIFVDLKEENDSEAIEYSTELFNQIASKF